METPELPIALSEDPYRSQFPPLMKVLRALGLKLGAGLFRDAIGARPERPLELFSMEGCPACRRVREVLTELEIDYVHRSCPKGPGPNRRELQRRGGKAQVPYLVDPNRARALYESKAIIAHLRRSYGAGARGPSPSVSRAA